MRRDHNYYVYIVTSQSGTFYTGVTNNLERRISEHRQGLITNDRSPEAISCRKPRTLAAGYFISGFAKKYGCNRLVYYEHGTDINVAIAREKQIKRWRREKKESLIKIINPSWLDLSADW
jgi:putative endonuclease